MRTVGNLKTFFIPGLDLSASGAASKLWVFATDAAGMTFTRSGDQTYISSGGTVETVTTDVSAHQDGGILLEGAATNLVWDSFNPATQTRTVTAVEHTLSIKGTGSVVLSGVGSGTATEAAPLTFTPTAGGLTMTVSGSVEIMQLETGSFATSFIETPSGASASRSATDLTTAYAFPANDFSGHIKVRPQFDHSTGSGTLTVFDFTDGSSSNRLRVYLSGSNDKVTLNKKIGASVLDIGTSANDVQYSANDVVNIRFKVDDVGMHLWVDGAAKVFSSASIAADPWVSLLNEIDLGSSLGGSLPNYQVVESLRTWNEAKPDAFLEALS